MAEQYTAKNIQVLEGLEHIRKRPGMYIGSTDVRGLNHILYEIIDNSMDEAANGYANRVDVTINEDGSATVEDNGRGMSADAIEVLRSRLSQPVQSSKESYGLKNLQQRLKLFYGDECGVQIGESAGGGLRVTIIARTMTCEEYETSRASQPSLLDDDFRDMPRPL